MRIIGAAALALSAGCAAHEAPTQRTVYFGFDRETLTAEAIEELAFLQKDAARLGAGSATVIGHADTRAGAEVNQALSLRRAETVRRDLIARGVPGDAIAVIGLGERAPAVATPDETIAAANRFATIEIADFGTRAVPDPETPYRLALPPELPEQKRPLSAIAPAEAADPAM